MWNKRDLPILIIILCASHVSLLASAQIFEFVDRIELSTDDWRGNNARIKCGTNADNAEP